jgi:hypothetical protein
MNKELDQMV